MNNKWLRTAIYIVFSYLGAGLLYSLTNTIYWGAQGKEANFGLTIGFLMEIIQWPWMVYADLKQYGVLPQDIAAFLPIVQFLVIFLIKKKPK